MSHFTVDDKYTALCYYFSLVVLVPKNFLTAFLSLSSRHINLIKNIHRKSVMNVKKQNNTKYSADSVQLWKITSNIIEDTKSNMGGILCLGWGGPKQRGGMLALRSFKIWRYIFSKSKCLIVLFVTEDKYTALCHYSSFTLTITKINTCELQNRPKLLKHKIFKYKQN